MDKVVVIGSLNVDFVVRTPLLPKEGQTVLGHSFDRFPGGKGANQSVGIARLGGHVTHIGKLGHDDSAQMLRESLESAGVLLDGLLEDSSSPTGIALIQVADSGENTIIVAPGANMNLKPSDLISFLPILKDAQIIALQNEIPLETNLHIARIGRELGARIVYNPAPFTEGSNQVCSLADLIVLNETELLQLVGFGISSDAEFDRALVKLLKMGNADAIIVTLGNKGSVLKDRNRVETFPAFKVKTKDTTAAGDAFIAGLIFSLSESKGLRSCVQFGSKVAAYAVTVVGAQSSMPTRRQLQEFIVKLEKGSV